MSINPTTEITLLPDLIDSVAVFTGEGLDDFLSKIKAETDKFVPDTTTAKGRKEIASMGYKVALSKTALDGLGKKLVEDWKNQAAKVDASRRKSREFLDNLRDEVRKPLTEWEVVEETRIKAEAEAAEYSAAWDEAHAMHELFLREKAIAAKEAEQALKEAEAARQAKVEADERIAKEKAEAAEKSRIAREEEIKKNAEERARIAAEQAERSRIAAEAKAKADQEAAVRAAHAAERATIEKEQKEKADDEAKAIAEAYRLAADLDHRASINRDVLDGMMESGITKEQGKHIIALIATGNIQHVSILY